MSARQKRWTVAVLGAWVAVHLFLLWRAWEPIARGYGDFAAFYTAGAMVRSGHGEQLYDRRAQWRLQQEFASSVEIRKGPLPYIRPPFEALMFAPLTVLPYPAACLVWMGIKVACLFWIPFLLRNKIPLPQPFPPWLVGALCLGLFPVFNDLLQGQDAVPFLLLTVLVLVSLRGKKELAAGALLGVGLMKFHLVLPMLLVLVLRRHMRVLIGFSATAFVLIGVSAWITGWGALLEYPRYLWELNQMPGAGVITWHSMPNLRGTLTALAPSFGSSPLVLLLVVALALTSLIWVARSWPSTPTDISLVAGFSLTIVITLLTSYYAYNYDLVLLLIPLLLLTEQAAIRLERRQRVLFLLLEAVVVTSPVYWFLLFGLDAFYLFSLVLAGLAVCISRMNLVSESF